MTIELYLAYVAATIIVLLIPGPTVMVVVSYALARGRRSALATVPGVVLGDLLAMSASLAGLGAVMAASAELFTVLKYVGAAYLIYLGIKMWRASPEAPADLARARRERAMLSHSFAVTALNPKSIVFFVAFLPQFIAAGAPLLPQLLILGATFLVLAFLNALGYAWLAGSIHGAVRRPGVLKAMTRAGGGVLIGAGLLTAAARRAT